MNVATAGVKHPDTQELHSLQILRGIAALSVVYYHIGAIPEFGSFGVDIFFVMSGFVIAMSLAKGQSATEFAIKRISRIVPLYWILTSVLLAIAYLAPHLLKSTTADLVNFAKSLFFIPYFKEEGVLRPMLAVGWTLNYEMFFYGALWLSLVFARPLYFPLGIVIVFAAHLYFGFYSDSKVLSTFFGNSQILEFLLGMVAFKLYKSSFWPNFSAPAALAISVLSYAVMALFESTGSRLNGLMIYGVPSIILMISMLNLESSIRSARGRFLKMFEAMGDASYATYLSHFFVVDAMRQFAFRKFNLLDPHTPLGVAIILILSLVLGHVLYKVIDKPLSELMRRRLNSVRLRALPIVRTP